jgi:hypothetical protein
MRDRIRDRGLFAYATEAQWRRSNRRAYYFMARGVWRQPSWYCKILAVRFMAIFVVMTAAALVLRREIPTLHGLRTRSLRRP